MSENITLYRSARRPARAPISYGTLVRHDDQGCEPATFETMSGIAKRGGAGQDGWQIGEDVLIQTDGEIRVELAESIELVVGGVLRRLQAGQAVMALLVGGRIVGGW